MKLFRTIATIAAFSIAGAAAAGPGGPKTTPKGPNVTTQVPKSGAQAGAKGASASSSKPGKNVASSKKPPSGTTTDGESTAPATPAVTAAGTAEPNAVSTKIAAKADQLARVQAMLPDGMTLEQATAGFRNQGQFLATLNASKNQNLNFVDLQKAVTVDGLSVGQAIKKSKSMPPAPAPGGSGGGTL